MPSSSHSSIRFFEVYADFNGLRETCNRFNLYDPLKTMNLDNGSYYHTLANTPSFQPQRQIIDHVEPCIDVQNCSHIHIELNGSLYHSQIAFRKPTVSMELMETANQNIIEIVCGPSLHQVKEFNILPTNILKVHYPSKNSDYISVTLVSEGDELKNGAVSIFLTAVSAKPERRDTNEIRLPNIKISKNLLQGRTKGYQFYLVYALISDGVEISSTRSTYFHIWSNVNQEGFPRQERMERIRERKQSNRKRRKLSCK